MAMGARHADIFKQFLFSGALLALAGTLAGLMIAAFAAQLIASSLYQVRPIDPAVFISVPLLLMVVALLASCLPARRAARVDPMSTLRQG